MLKLLERSIRAVDQRLVLLAPPQVAIPSAFENVDVDLDFREALVREMQRLRGRVYLQDGAIERRQLSWDGLHRTPEDKRSWHLLMLNSYGRISACVWYLEHESPTAMHNLRVRKTPLAESPEWSGALWKAVASELSNARRNRLRYAEVGGWAVTKESRCTSEGLVLAIAAYSLGRVFGGALGMTMATVRHCSSTILRRLGGSPLEADGVALPPYYDPAYRCEMELLRFDSRRPNVKYAPMIDLMKQELAKVLVVTGHRSVVSEQTDSPAAAPQPLYAA
jgi:hypothetical protein